MDIDLGFLIPLFRSLQDETRVRIYRFLVENQQTYNCQELAATFLIHANVMRDHLKTLESAKLVIEERPSYRTTKTGRKPMVYRANPNMCQKLMAWNQELSAVVS